MTSVRGRYVVIDGPDGCGKTEQARNLVARLAALGCAGVRHLREPGSTPVGERLRELLLDPSTGELAPWTEALLFYAARAELLRREIEPSLAAGRHVVVERCYLSTLVYQGWAWTADAASGDVGPAVDLAVLDQLTNAVHAATRPDLLLVLDVDPAVAARRRSARGDADRIESRGEDYLHRVRNGFRELANREPAARVLDANADRESVAAEVWMAMTDCLQREAKPPESADE